MKIVGVAFEKGGVVISMQRPKRHCDIIREFPGELHDWEQGFLLDTGDFAGRRDALKVARKAGQLKRADARRPLPGSFNELYSEDVW